MPLRSTFAGARLRDPAVDAGLALAAFGGTVALLAHAPASRRLDTLAVVLAAASALPLLWWRRAPLAAFVLAALCAAALAGAGYAPGPPLPATIALFLVAASRDAARPWTRRTTAVVASLFVAHVTATGLGHEKFPAGAFAFGILGWVLAWFAGDRVRLRRERIAELEERARRNERDAERERRLAAAEERMRIARDLHDSAGHAINVILVQAGAARLLQGRDPAGSQAALETVEAVARRTVGEIDQMVAALRDGAAGTIEAPAGLAGLDGLIDQVRAGGLEVTLETHGRRRPLPPSVEQAAYRILQESLTNAARHGSGPACAVLSFGGDSLEIAVTNPATDEASAKANGSHGLVGMRERAALLGGSFAVRASGGTFAVVARLPIGGDAA